MKSAPKESANSPEPQRSATPAALSTPAPAPAPAQAPPTEFPPLGRTRFTSQLEVRPDDIDMFQHVHSSRYLDYVLAARFEQMAQGYGMAMEEFLKIGYAWFQKSANIEFKRPLRLGDKFTVTTWIETMERDTVRVDFEIRRADNNKVSCDGHCHYTLVNVATGRGEPIPDWIARKYAI